MNPITKTGLDLIDISPLDYWWKFLKPDREPYVKSKDVVFDEALRCLVFTPALFYSSYVKQPDIKGNTNIAKAEREAVKKSISENNQVLLSLTDYDAILEMAKAVKSHPAASILFENGYPGILGEFLQEDVPVIFTPHWIYNNRCIVNLCSASDAGALNFSKEAYNFKWYKRAALQMDGTGYKEFYFVLVEKKPPYKIQIHTLDDAAILLGRSEYIRNCKTYAECVVKNEWPGLPESIESVSLPVWAFKNNPEI